MKVSMNCCSLLLLLPSKSFLEEGGRAGMYRLAGLAWPEGVRLREFSWFLVLS